MVLRRVMYRKGRVGSVIRCIRPLTVVFLASSVLALLATSLDDRVRAAEPSEPSEPTAAASTHAAPLRRLTRTEYANSVRDLFGVEFPITDELPADGQLGGFDNNGDALAVTPVLLESYLKVARKISDLVIGQGSLSAITETFKVEGSQSDWVEGLPMGTRGGARIEYFFPRDGLYELRAFLDYLAVGGYRISSALALTPTEGVRVFRERVKLSAGKHTLFVTFPNEYSLHEGVVPNLSSATGGRGLGGPIDVRGSAIRPQLQLWVDGKPVRTFDIQGPGANEAAFEVQPGPPILGSVEIKGPFSPASKVHTEIRRRLLTCSPRSRAAEKKCSEEILTRIASRAYRRDVSARDMEPILHAFSRKRESAGFDDAISQGLKYILVSPDFLFRIESDPDGLEPGASYRISDTELASRLSFFLWSSIPDEALRDSARAGKLRGEDLNHEVLRMLADHRADALVDNFASQWLELRTLEGFRPDRSVYENFDDDLARAVHGETRLFLRTLMRDNRSILEVISSDYTFLNERLATLYGIPGVNGAALRKVPVSQESHRGGLLGQASFLMLSSHPSQTSPILRGKWILANLLNAPPPPPPAGVPPLDTAPASDGRTLTTREQIERHRSSPVCASCHSKMDPYGMALENFDVVGRWRTEEGGNVLDTTAALPRSQPFTGPAGLKAVLLERSDEFAAATVSRLMSYALGRRLDKSDAPAVQAIVQSVKPGGYRFSDIIVAIVNSPLFSTRQAAPGHGRQT